MKAQSTNLFRDLIIFFTTATCLSFVSCAADVSSSIGVPKIIVPASSGEARSRISLSVSLSGIRDVRPTAEVLDRSGAKVTQPHGGIETEIEDAISRAFSQKGIRITGSAPNSISAEVRRWRSKVSTTTSSKIESEATLYLEVTNQCGHLIYSGSYNGIRKSQFPIVSSQDVKDSLGYAMSEAIQQPLQDNEFLAALWAEDCKPRG